MATRYELEGDAVERKGRLEGIWGVSQWLALRIFSYVKQIIYYCEQREKAFERSVPAHQCTSVRDYASHLGPAMHSGAMGLGVCGHPTSLPCFSSATSYYIERNG